MSDDQNNRNNLDSQTKGMQNSESLADKINTLHSERRQEYHDSSFDGNETPRSRYAESEEIQHKKGKKNNRGILIGIFVLLAVIILGFGAWLLVDYMGTNSENSAEDTELTEDDEMSAKELELQQMLAQSEFENLEKEFTQYELSQQEIIVNDTIKQQLQRKYEQARLQVEELRNQLKDANNKSAAEIKSLNDQIKTLRELLKHYLEEIDRLNKENAQLRNENEDLRQNLDRTTSTLQHAQSENERLTERMTLAEKLNVTGVAMNMLNKKGKIEKKIKNAKQFVITFTIPQNNSTPPGTKNIYAVITTPEGQILDGAGSFIFEGSNVTASARKQIEYGGEEIGGITMYYDIRNALSPGTYSVQLFCDGYALMSRPLQVPFKN